MFARRTGAAWEVFAPAKLNLYLEVLGRRDDGFHELETLMAPIHLYDHLQWRPAVAGRSTPFLLAYSPATRPELRAAAPPDERNLVWQAVHLLGRDAGVEPHGQFLMTKRIPAQAGLGGGSSDAAAALVLANAAWNVGYPREKLVELGAKLGSDVPFFLAGGSAICRGRGERVQPISVLPRLNVVIVKPPVGISTAEAFGQLGADVVTAVRGAQSAAKLASLVRCLERGAIAAAGRWMGNSLQGAASRMSVWIDRLRHEFARLGCLAHLMTGSGSAYFGVMRSARQMHCAAGRLLSQDVGAVFTSATIR